MGQYTKIQGFDLPDIFPEGYQEYVWTDRRVNRHEQNEIEVINTAEKYQFYNDDSFQVRKIQFASWRKYSLQLLLQPRNDYSLLFGCENVKITLGDGTVHFADIIEASPTRQSDTFLKVVEITYIDRNPENYSDFPVSNLMTSSNIKRKIVAGGYRPRDFDTIIIMDPTVEAAPSIAPTTLKTYFTKLISKKITAPLVNEQETVAGAEVDSIRYIKTGYEIDLFFSNKGATSFQENFLASANAFIRYGKAGRTDALLSSYEDAPIEDVKVEREDLGGSDIVRIRLTYINKKTKVTPYV